MIIGRAITIIKRAIKKRSKIIDIKKKQGILKAITHEALEISPILISQYWNSNSCRSFSLKKSDSEK